MRSFLIIVLFVVSMLSCKEYSSIKTHSSDVLYFRVVKEKTPVFKRARNSADVLFFLSNGDFVQYLKKSKKFSKICYKDADDNVLEGWLRTNTLSKQKYYSNSCIDLVNGKKKKLTELNLNYKPSWVNKKCLIFKDSLGTKKYSNLLDKGVFVEVYGSFLNKKRVKFYNNGIKKSGFINPKFLSEIFVKSDYNSNLSELENIISPEIMTMGIAVNGFLAYSTIKIVNNNPNRYTSEVRCLEDGIDSLVYKSTKSRDRFNVHKRNIIRGEKSLLKNIIGFKILPDEVIRTTNDEANCKVIELIYRPKVAKINFGKTVQEHIVNKKEKIYILPMKKSEQNLIFRRMITKYDYKRSIISGEVDEKTELTEVLKNLIAYRFY